MVLWLNFHELSFHETYGHLGLSVLLHHYSKGTCVLVLIEPVVLPSILPGQALAIPLHLTSWRLQSRPKDLGLFFCKVPIHWTSVEQPGEVYSSKRECHSADFDDNLKSSFRYIRNIIQTCLFYTRNNNNKNKQFFMHLTDFAWS